jgi:UDPglucose 6-dehydrogenase
MNQPILIDGRNIYDPHLVREMGFLYMAIGRGYNGVGIEEIME